MTTVTIVRTSGGIVSEFPVTIGLYIYQLYLFTLVIDELSRLIQDELMKSLGVCLLQMI